MAEHESLAIIYDAIIAIGIGIGVATGLMLLSRIFSKTTKKEKNYRRKIAGYPAKLSNEYEGALVDLLFSFVCAFIK